jgi:hypothetical protein
MFVVVGCVFYSLVGGEGGGGRELGIMLVKPLNTYAMIDAILV